MARPKGATKPFRTGYVLSFLIGMLVGAAILATITKGSDQKHGTAPPQTSNKKPHLTTDKPWGVLETSKIALAKDEQLFPDREQRLCPPTWFFENFSQKEVAEFLTSCNLDSSQDSQLTSPGGLQVLTNGCLVHPPEWLVQSLKPATRSKIYSVLARSPLNYAQRYPFRFMPDSFAAHFKSAELPREKVDLLHSLTYTNGTDLCLADLELLPNLLTTNEFDEVVDCLYRVPAYRVRLHVYPDSDIEALIRYWGKGSRAARIRPLLQSLAKTPGDDGDSINVGYFLPPFARLRLYTFPDAWNDAQMSKEDCFWTSMNFFRNKADMRFLDPAEVRKALQSDYLTIHEQPAFGDLVTLINSSGDAIHMCVYIADDFVFTKNGKTTLAPWVLMKISDMLSLFPSENGRKIVIFRQKEPPGNIDAGPAAQFARHSS